MGIIDEVRWVCSKGIWSNHLLYVGFLAGFSG